MTATQKQLGDWTARPKQDDPRVNERVFAAIMPEIRVWLGKEYREDADEQIRGMLKDSWADDGYKLARWMERKCNWSPDTGLVDILEGVEGERFKAHREIVAEWVAGSGRQPTYAMGSAVQYEGAAGKIVGVDLKHGTYTVCIPSKGHVETGMGTRGIVVPWEEIDGANP